MKFQRTPHANVRGRRKRVPCEGSRSTTRHRLSDDRGICPACGQTEAIYDSSRVGHGLLVDHERPVDASVKAS
jgi:hypothetical protein